MANNMANSNYKSNKSISVIYLWKFSLQIIAEMTFTMRYATFWCRQLGVGTFWCQI